MRLAEEIYARQREQLVQSLGVGVPLVCLETVKQSTQGKERSVTQSQITEGL